MSKKTISLILGVVVLSLGVVFGVILVGQDQDFRERAAPSSTITLNSSDPTPKVGEQFTISANIDTGGNSVIASELYFEFDSAKLEVLDVVNGSFFLNPEVIGPTIDNDAGKVDYVTFILPGVEPSTGVGTLINLSVRAKAAGTAVVSLSPDTIVGATQENAQNVLVSSFPITIDVQPAGGVGGGNQVPTSTPVPTTTVAPTVTTAVTPTPISGTSSSTVIPTSVFSTVTPTTAEGLPDELPDTGVGEVAMVVGVVGFILLLGSMVLAL